MMGRALSQNGQKDSHFFSFRNIHDFRFFTISTIPGPWDGSFLTKVIFFFFLVRCGESSLSREWNLAGQNKSCTCMIPQRAFPNSISHCFTVGLLIVNSYLPRVHGVR